MNMPRRDPDDLLDITRVILLVQGSILVATTIEALVFSAGFAGAAGSSVLLSAAAALVVLVARARLNADRDWTRRLLYIVEGVILASLAIDTVLASLITHASPPTVALLTRLVIPVAVLALLRRSTTAAAATPAATPGGVS